jgi:hypothetical protein
VSSLRPVAPLLAALACQLALGCASRGGTSRPPASAGGTGSVLVMFLVDGLMAEAVQTAVAAGAPHIKQVLDEGVRVQTVHGTSPAAVIQLPPGSPGGEQPWGFASSGNVAVHTGCHLFESAQMDDIFLAARDAGIKSVFAGGAPNYSVFVTADFHYGAQLDDATVVAHGVTHLKNDGARLLRLHLQRIRDVWTGPADRANPESAYIKYLTTTVDGLLGQVIDALKEADLWERTHLVLAADHGMDDSGASTHSPASPPAWDPFLAFRGPGLKRGATIPYGELPDVAVTAAHLLGLRPLRGLLDPAVTLPVRGPTGTVLTNLLAGQPDALAHPRYLERCLQQGTACTGTADDYAPYRQTMLGLIR